MKSKRVVRVLILLLPYLKSMAERTKNNFDNLVVSILEEILKDAEK